MKKLILLFLFFVTFCNIYAQSGWQWQNPLPQGNDYLNVKFINSRTGYAIGKSGTVVKTTNGGINWKITNSGVYSSRIGLISVVDSNTVFISNGDITFGGGNQIFRSLNGGDNWQFMGTSPYQFKGICFINSNTGFITSNNIFKTTDGGISWTVSYSTSISYSNIKFINENTGFAAGAGSIIGTTNQGISWSECHSDSSTVNFGDLNFIDNITGYITSTRLYANNKLYKTTNSGVNWVLLRTLPFNFGQYFTVHFTENNKAFATSQEVYKGNVYRTSNEGVSWDTVKLDNISVYLDSPASDTCIVVGQGGLIYRTSNFGSNWVCLSSQFGNIRRSNFVTFCDDNTGYITCDNGSYFKSTNAGANWNLFNIGNYNLGVMHFIDNQTGFTASLYSTYGTYNKIFKTTSGGLHWDTLSIPSSININSIYFINSNTGFYTSGFQLIKTTNGGINWSIVNIPVNYSISTVGSVNFIDSQTGYFYTTFEQITGQYFDILKSIDGGNNWHSIYHNSESSIINSVKFTSENTGYISAGNIYKTTNGGLNWSYVLNSTFSQIRTIDNNTIYGGSYKSTNSGLNWTLYNTKIQSINSIYYINQNTGILVGGSGASILRTTDGGEIISSVNLISANVPDIFLLHQNYPNPFNPSTKINYEIKSSGFVSLKVFNLLGKEVATLVNEKQNPGTYAVDFNSSEFNLPSGIYFYTLNTGDFKETKKMVLVK